MRPPLKWAEGKRWQVRYLCTGDPTPAREVFAPKTFDQAWRRATHAKKKSARALNLAACERRRSNRMAIHLSGWLA
jgi:hypothetical protein